MAERARFEIYPTVGGRYHWLFRVDGEPTVRSAFTFESRDEASEAIHDFMWMIDNADCGIHPDIVDVEEA